MDIYEKIGAIATGITAIVALITFVLQFFRETERKKRESTLNAYRKLQADVFSRLNEIDEKKKLSSLVPSDDEWKDVTKYLAQIENFCVGINTKIYAIKTLNRLGGAFFIDQLKKLSPIISQKRQADLTSLHYDEFEAVVKKLVKVRGYSRIRRMLFW